jgi:hypothetical protein
MKLTKQTLENQLKETTLERAGIYNSDICTVKASRIYNNEIHSDTFFLISGKKKMQLSVDDFILIYNAMK